MKKSGFPLFIKIMVLVIIAACVAPFFIKGRDGRPLLRLGMLKMPEISTQALTDLKSSVSRLKKEALPQVAEKVSTVLDRNTPEPERPDQPMMRLYKWRDENGVMRFSDRPNPTGPSEIIHVPLGDKAETPKPVVDRRKPAEPTNEKPKQKGLPDKLAEINEYVTRAARVKKDAEAVKKKLEENYREQQRIMDELAPKK